MALTIEELLLKDEKITQEQLDKARENKKSTPDNDIGDILVELGFVDNQTLADYVLKILTG